MTKKRQRTPAASKDDEPLTPASKNDQPLTSAKKNDPQPPSKTEEEKVEEKDDEDSTSEEALSSEGEEDGESEDEESEEEEQPPSSQPASNVFGSSMDLLKSGAELLDESTRIEFEKRWEELQIAELEVFKIRAELFEEQVRFISDALMMSSSSD